MTLNSTFAFPRSAFLGFDHIFDELNNIRLHAHDGYPPHNVIKTGEKTYTIELAVAGFKKSDLKVDIKDHVLNITGNREQRRPAEDYVHRGLSTRKFSKSYRLSEYTEVVGADLNDGILTVNLEVIVPQEKLPKSIAIK